MRTAPIRPFALAAAGALLLGALIFSATAHAQVASSTSAQNTSPSSALTGGSGSTSSTPSTLSSSTSNTSSTNTSSTVTSTATGAGSTQGGTAPAFVSLSAPNGAPGDDVLISGAGFLPGENVQVSFGGTSTIVPAATDGSFSAPLAVPQIPDGVTSVSAQGLQSGRIAATTFTVGASNLLSGVASSTAASSTMSLASTTPLSDAEAIQILQSEVSSLQAQVASLTAEVTVLQGAAGTGMTP